MLTGYFTVCLWTIFLEVLFLNDYFTKESPKIRDFHLKPRLYLCYNKPMTNQKKLLLIDGSSVAFRAFSHSIIKLTVANNNGLHTHAIYGFHPMLDNLLERIQPTHVLVAFDAGKQLSVQRCLQTIRLVVPRLQRNFVSSSLYIREMLAARGIAYYDLAQYEADDIIGTSAFQDGWKYQWGLPNSLMSLGIKTWFSWLTKTQSLRFRRKVWLSLRLHTWLPHGEMGDYPAQFIDLKALWEISPIIFQGLLRLVKRLDPSSSLNTVPFEGIYEHRKRRTKTT